jgi:hypothetical protein
MPIAFDLEELRKKHQCVNYLETGLYDPREDVSIKHALRSGFEKCISIEIREDWVSLGKEIFQKEIADGRVTLIQDDSTRLKQHLDPAIFQHKSMFFLDAHVDNSNIHHYQKKCPLLEELDAISVLDRKDHVILIDDLRILQTPFPWGETSYENKNFIDEIIKKIQKINPLYQFKLLDGYIKNDVILAYV